LLPDVLARSCKLAVGRCFFCFGFPVKKYMGWLWWLAEDPPPIAGVEVFFAFPCVGIPKEATGLSRKNTTGHQMISFWCSWKH
jgi:hypothetical protein